MNTYVITEDQEDSLLKLYNTGQLRISELAAYYDITEATVKNVIHRGNRQTLTDSSIDEIPAIMQLLKQYKLDYAGLKYTLGTLDAT